MTPSPPEARCECQDGGQEDRDKPGYCLCTGKLNRITDYEAGYLKGRVELRELQEALDAVDEMFVWLQKHYPKALDELPTPIYQRVRIASLALAASSEEPG